MDKCKLFFRGRLSNTSIHFGDISQIIVLNESGAYKVVVSSLLKDCPEEYTEIAYVTDKYNAFDLADALVKGYCQYYYAFYTGEWSGMKEGNANDKA